MGKILTSFGGSLFYSLSLSYSWTLRFFLENSWRSVAYFRFGARRKTKVGMHKRTLESTTTSGFACRYRVACMISSLFLACMTYACGYLVMMYHWHGRFRGLTVVFPSLAISWIAMVLWVSFLLFSGWFSCSFGCVLSY